MMIDGNMTVEELQKSSWVQINISMRSDEYLSLESMAKTCHVLDCKVDDDIELIPQKEAASRK